MSSLWFRIVPLVATLTVSVVSGTFYLVRLAHECKSDGYLVCIQSVVRSPSEPSKAPTEAPKPKPNSAPTKTGPGPAAERQASPQQDNQTEAMLISTGHLDGEVGRVGWQESDITTWQGSAA